MRIDFVRVGDRYFTEVERDGGAVVRLRGPKPLGHPPVGKGGEIEAIVALVARIAEQPRRDGESIRTALRTSLTAPIRERARLEPAAVERMCRRLDDLRGRWEKLPNGGRISLEFPSRTRRV